MVILKLLSSDEELEHFDDSDRKGVAEKDDVIEMEPGREVTPLSHTLSSSISKPIRSIAVSGEESAGNSRRSPAKKKFGSKRAAEDEGYLNTTKKKKKRIKKKNKTLFSSSDAEAFPDNAVAATIISDDSGGDEGNKKDLGAIKRVFSEEDDIAVLKGVIEYRAKTGLTPNSDSGAFYDFIKDHLRVEVSKRQVMEKIRSLQRKFRVTVGKCEEPMFTRPHDSRVFELSKEIWSKTEANGEIPNDNDASLSRKKAKQDKSNNAAIPDTVVKKPIILGLPSQSASKENQQKSKIGEGLGKDVGECEMAAKNTSNEHGKVKNVESKNGEGPDKGDAEREVTAEEPKKASKEHRKVANMESESGEGPGGGDAECEVAAEEPKTNPEVVINRIDDVVDEGGDGKKTGGGDADEFWAQYAFLKYAVDMIVSKGLLGDFPKGLFLEKVRGFGADKGKAWDEKWMALCFEEMELEVRRRDLVTKLSKAALDAWKKKK